MEYVGGKSLKQILQDARRDGGSVPLAHAIAYAVEVLLSAGVPARPGAGVLRLQAGQRDPDRGAAQAHRHGRRARRRQRRTDLRHGRLPGARDRDRRAVGVLRPVHGGAGAGRAHLRVQGYQSSYKFTFPDAVPLLEQQESFARLLRRATHSDPERRFGSAGEMAEQLTGVLREVLATADGTRPVGLLHRVQPRAQADRAGRRHRWSRWAESPALAVPRAAEIIAGMPMPQVDRADPAAGYLATFAGLDSAQRGGRAVPARSRATRPCPPRSPPPPRRGWRWRAPSSTSATTTEPGPRWPTWPPRTRPTGGSPGPRRACWLPGDRYRWRGGGGRAGRVQRGLRRAPRRARAQARAGLRGRSRRGRRVRRPLLQARLDRGPVVHQRRVRPGPGLPGDRRPARRDRARSRRYRRRPATTRRRRSPRSGSWCHPG